MTLSKKQITRQDFVDNAIFKMLQEINPSDIEIDWSIEIIGEIRDKIQEVFVEKLSCCDEQAFYPFLKE